MEFYVGLEHPLLVTFRPHLLSNDQRAGLTRTAFFHVSNPFLLDADFVTVIHALGILRLDYFVSESRF